MSDLLRKAWILPAALSFLSRLRASGSEYDEDEEYRPPKIVQLVEVYKTNGFVKAKIADKFNYLPAVFNQDFLEGFEEDGVSMIESMGGALIKLTDFTFTYVDDLIALVIGEFEAVGPAGAPIHGDPRYLMAIPSVGKAMEDLKAASAPQSFKPYDLVGLNSGKQADDLLSYENVCIPEDQQTILDSIVPGQACQVRDKPALELATAYYCGLQDGQRAPVNYDIFIL